MLNTINNQQLMHLSHVSPKLGIEEANSFYARLREEVLRPASTASAEKRPMHAAYASDMPISATLLSARTYNALQRGRVMTVGQLCALKRSDLKWLRNFGKKAEQEVAAYRASLGAPLQPMT
jgi:DNA-directed RNA polymerase alpha subunit